MADEEIETMRVGVLSAGCDQSRSLSSQATAMAILAVANHQHQYCTQNERIGESQLQLTVAQNANEEVVMGRQTSTMPHKQTNKASMEMQTPAFSKATQRPSTTLAGITEDHRHEQFFYNEQTANRLYQLVDLYHHPLLLCNPTLAFIAGRKNKIYKLLNYDTRFDFLSRYKEFSLTEPHLMSDFRDFDVVFMDPPFANVTPLHVVRKLPGRREEEFGREMRQSMF